MSLQNKFTPQELERVKEAVRQAEDKISGEIVPVMVAKSGHYSIAVYRGAIVMAMLAFVFMIVLDRYLLKSDSNALLYDPIFIFLVVVVGGVAGAAVAHFIDPVKKLLMEQTYLDQATQRRAESAFLEEEVFNTRQRTGIMIFISFFEHEVIVMADRGISKVVDQKDWDQVVNRLVEKIKGGDVIGGLEAAIGRCGEILLEHGFHKTADDVNELGDDLRVN
ncbi:MAG: hypothetical protein JNL17_11890 [Cyclobacteriaceae bacterium]|nr:hypothetical protein [Cyclobacteriaceae bacterium]